MKKINNTNLLLILLFGIIFIGLFYFRQSMERKPKMQNEKQNIPEKVNIAEGKEITIIAFGDSLTAGYGLPLYDSYPSQLEKILQKNEPSISVINAGISGETTKGNFERADFIREQNPNIVILGIGGNDALRLLPIAETQQNIENTIKKLLSGTTSPKVLLLIMQAPLNSGASYKKEFDALYPRLSAKYSLTLIPFIVPEVSLDKKYLQNDGIHPTKEGYSILVEKYVAPIIIQELKKGRN